MNTNESAQQVIEWLDQNQSIFTEMADEIWRNPELAWKEFKSSHLQADYLENEGFSIAWNIGGQKTAFVAEWGEGKPILGFIGEYDALPGLSQKLQPTKEPIHEDGPGHGCGHNLLGAGTVASAVAVQKWLKTNNKSGTVRYYGCPAEEKGSGKVFMARVGAFDDLDAALNFHPANMNTPSKGGAVGVNAIYFRFYGQTAHAGGSPHKGRSALDAVELMNVGVNYLREHVKDDVRMHYIITEGGKAPNIVPEEAEVYYFLRAAKPDYLTEIVERVHKVAEGAALMTETTFETHFEEGCSALLSNHYLADMQYQAMELIGPIEFTQEEIDFAQTINDAFPGTNSDYIDDRIEYYKAPPEIVAALDEYRDQPLVGRNFAALDEHIIATGSTDVGDLSQIVPVSLLRTTCFPTGVPGHSWGNVATSGMSIGHKGMMHAAKIMAVAAVELYSDLTHLEKIQQEFKGQTGDKPYIPPIPDDVKPPHYEPEGD
ncbi:MAG: amidohydrolase [Anaerolineaceae bacterium]|nr:MAG: amidohydrolase [Anaerolineaceae bacterium]